MICLGDWIRGSDRGRLQTGNERSAGVSGEGRVRVVRDGQIVSIPSSQLNVGDTIIVYPGEMVPADGDILHGEASIDQKTITGESFPITRAKGDAVFAVTVLREGQITIRASQGGLADDRWPDCQNWSMRRRLRIRACRIICGKVCRPAGSADAGAGDGHEFAGPRL